MTLDQIEESFPLTIRSRRWQLSWYGTYYLEDPLMLWRQLRCFFVGHLLALEEVGHGGLYGFCGQYCCQHCGEIVLLQPKPHLQQEMAKR